MKRTIFFLIFLTTIAFAFLILSNSRKSNNETQINSSIQNSIFSIFVENLEVPWAIAFLPDGNLLVTERPGRVRFIDKNGKLDESPLLVLEDVKNAGEGGLLGITIHPDFKNNNFIYLYYTYGFSGSNTLNRVVRYTLENKKLINRSIIVDQIPGSSNHNGGRIKFGPDNFLYITTGDAQNPSLAQDKNSLAGKILRVTDEGKAAFDNPLNNLVYSYGHRNPQGLAWDEKGQLFETEHGPVAHDEINIIQKGGNYGWPNITGDEKQSGMITPLTNSGNSTWAPAGTAHINGSLFFGGLRGQALFEAKINQDNITTVSEHFKNEFGRIREVTLGPNNLLYITTSNLDGRGTPGPSDDKIIIVDPNKL